MTGNKITAGPETSFVCGTEVARPDNDTDGNLNASLESSQCEDV